MLGQKNAPTPGYLFVWTNVDPADEEEFNRWYDREHVAERIALPGFVSGLRYIARDGALKYLGLYRTRSLDAFRSERYRQAFSHQTAWSIANLGRMKDCMRRVCAVVAETGVGTGAFLAVLRFGRQAGAGDIEALRDECEAVQRLDGVIATRLLVPDATLSSPLPAEKSEGRLLDPILLIEATSEAVVRGAVQQLKRNADATAEISILNMMWQLTESDLAAARVSESVEGLCG